MKHNNKKDSENLREKALRQRTSLNPEYIYPSWIWVQQLEEQIAKLERLREQIELWKTDKDGLNRPGLDEFGGNR